MRRSLVLLALLLAGCDPFVAELDEPSACITVTGRSFNASGTGLSALLPLDVSLDGKLAADPTAKRVELVSVEVSAPSARLDLVRDARVQVLPSAPMEGAVSGLVVSSQRAPELRDGSLSIAGSDADLFPQLSAGAVKLDVEVEGEGLQPFQGDVTACVRVTVSGHYLQHT